MTYMAQRLQRIRRMERKIHGGPKNHVFVVEEGEEPTPEQQAQVRPGDRVVIRQYPKGYTLLFEKKETTHDDQ